MFRKKVDDIAAFLSSAHNLTDLVLVSHMHRRENHTGTLSGMTRFRDHLDDMPAAGYAMSAIALDRVQSFLALMFGHIANYHSRGTYNVRLPLLL